MPLSPTGQVGGGGGLSRSSLGLRPSINRTPKAKRRWCVLDATCFTLYRTGRTGRKYRVKTAVPLDPRAVALVTPPFTPSAARLGSTGGRGGAAATNTTERDAVALVCFNMPPEVGTLVIRAEQVTNQEIWVRALATRLTSKDHYARMAQLYGGAAGDE